MKFLGGISQVIRSNTTIYNENCLNKFTYNYFLYTLFTSVKMSENDLQPALQMCNTYFPELFFGTSLHSMSRESVDKFGYQRSPNIPCRRMNYTGNIL